MNDILTELRSLRAAQPLDSGAYDTLTRTIDDLIRRRSQCDDLQRANTALVVANRDLKAIIGGHPVVRIKRIGAPDLEPPRYETDGAAGMDLRADLTMPLKLPLGAEIEPAHTVPGGPSVRPRTLRIHPGARVAVPCGFAFQIPEGYEGSVRGRSGWMKRGLYAAGTVDSDYRGVVFSLLENRSAEPVDIEHSARVAQMVIAAAPQARLEEAAELTATARGAGGFSSTGVR